MSHVGVKKFIMLVEVQFPRQKFSGDEDKEAIWLRTMNEDLGHYDDDVLVEAANKIRRTRDPNKDGTMFPKTKECVAACESVKASLKLRNSTPLLPKAEKSDDWSDDRLALAFDLVNGEMGRRAAREGWISSLYHFARKNMRLPQPPEVAAIIAERRSLESFIQGLRDKERPTSMDAALIQFAETVEKRRDELADGVASGVVERNSWFLRG